MKKSLSLLLLCASPLLQADAGVNTYLEFEKYYMDHNVTKLEQWMADDYSMQHAAYFSNSEPQFLPPAKKEPILKFMRVNEIPNSDPRATAENVVVESETGFALCTRATLPLATPMNDGVRRGKEIRKVCFNKNGEQYQAVKHILEVHYE